MRGCVVHGSGMLGLESCDPAHAGLVWGLRTFLLISVLSLIAASDIRTRRIPDACSLALVLIDWGFLAVGSESLRSCLGQILALSAMGLLVCAGLLLAAGIAGRIFGGSVFGGGDIKLIAAFAAMPSAPSLCLLLLLSCLLALCFAGFKGLRLKETIPYAPFLVAGFVIAYAMESILV